MMGSKPLADVVDLNSHRTPLEQARSIFNEGREEFWEALRQSEEWLARETKR